MPSTQTELQRQLLTDCQAVADVARNRSEDQFRRQINGKWSVAEVIQHLCLSARPVLRLMTGPRETLAVFGKPDCMARSYDEMAAIYRHALTTGLKAPANFSPRPVDADLEREDLISRFTDLYGALSAAVEGWPEEELDAYVIPHPALGQLSVREMLYFTSVHTQHHLRLLREQ